MIPRALSGSASTRSILPLTATPGASSYALNDDLELARHERRARSRIGPHELLEIALQPLAELAALEIVDVDAQARVERAVDAPVHQLDGRLDVLRRHPLGAGITDGSWL